MKRKQRLMRAVLPNLFGGAVLFLIFWKGETNQMRWDYWIKGSLAVASGSLSYIFGGWSLLLQVLVALVVADYVTGFLASAVQGKLASNIGYKGIAKKTMIFVMVGVAHLLDLLFGEGSIIQDSTIAFYAFNELLSIIENCGKAGVPVPSIIRKAVQVLKTKDDEEIKLYLVDDVEPLKSTGSGETDGNSK